MAPTPLSRGIRRNFGMLPLVSSSAPLLLLVLAVLTPPCSGAAAAGPKWPAQYNASLEQATATYYGNHNGSETLATTGCGYPDLNTTGVGLLNAAASIAMWNSGAICGACFLLQCINSNKYCRKGASTIVTVTNQCPQGSEGGWCNRPHRHLDMSFPAWMKIANNPAAGIVSTSMQRVPCPRSGGVGLRLFGNAYHTSAIFYNLGGSGDLATVEVSTNRGQTWKQMNRNWGAAWSTDGLVNKGLSFRLTSLFVKDTLVLLNVLPATWQYRVDYRTTQNFKSVPPLQLSTALSGPAQTAFPARRHGAHA